MIIARTIQCSTSRLGEVTHHCGVESYCIYACNKTHLHFQTALHSSGTIRQFQLSTMFSFSLPKKNRGWKSILSLSHHIPVLCIYYQQCTYQIIIIYIFLNAKPSQTYLLGILWQELDRLRTFTSYPSLVYLLSTVHIPNHNIYIYIYIFKCQTKPNLSAGHLVAGAW
jgi:hypothetical protein